MARKTTRTDERFQRRVRFNHGFHDAWQAVEEGWATPERNFGFARSGGMVFASPDDVPTKHFDRHYGLGWISGYEAALRGDAHGTSDAAWADAINNELVAS